MSFSNDRRSIPALTDSERKCEDCGNPIREAYCSAHDDFYELGHKSSCPTMTGKSPVNNNHGPHCRYSRGQTSFR